MTRFDNADGRLSSKDRTAARLRLWSASPYCAKCASLTTLDYPHRNGFELDHITPLALGGSNDDDNLQVLCAWFDNQGIKHGCHADKTALEAGTHQAASNYPEWLQPAACRVTVVCGPPGSGKSRYVAEHAKQGDDVLDLDVIISELSGLPLYRAGKEWLNPAIRERNRRLCELATANPALHVWLIVSAAGKTNRQWWADKLGTDDVILLDTPSAVCIKRIRGDLRRGDMAQHHIDAALEWWRKERSLVAHIKRPSFSDEGRVVW